MKNLLHLCALAMGASLQAATVEAEGRASGDMKTARTYPYFPR